MFNLVTARVPAKPPCLSTVIHLWARGSISHATSCLATLTLDNVSCWADVVCRTDVILRHSWRESERGSEGWRRPSAVAENRKRLGPLALSCRLCVKLKNCGSRSVSPSVDEMNGCVCCAKGWRWNVMTFHSNSAFLAQCTNPFVSELLHIQ